MDNDILLKGVCYAIAHDIVRSTNGAPGGFGVLGSARFVLESRIKRASLNCDRVTVLAHLASTLAASVVLEPTEGEQQFAAELELAGQTRGLSLDTGESQLCAILVNRGIPLLLTGDKRAILSLERLRDVDVRLDAISGRVRCFEQVILRLILEQGTTDALRTAVCGERTVDITMTICFGCDRGSITTKEVIDGLESYILALRTDAGHVLAS